jgi:hypothetical protein
MKTDIHYFQKKIKPHETSIGFHKFYFIQETTNEKIEFSVIKLQNEIMHFRLLPMEDFISLFSKISCHLKYFETVNETTPKIYDFILEFYNTKFYVVPLIGYVLK